jgi:hypothetical protein
VRPPSNQPRGLRTNPGADFGRLPHTMATGHSAGRSSDDNTLDASPEEMADGDPQMAECLWRSTLSRGPQPPWPVPSWRATMRCPQRSEPMKKPSRAGGKPAKALPSKALKPKGRSAPKAMPRRGSAPAGQDTEVARLTRERDEASLRLF